MNVPSTYTSINDILQLPVAGFDMGVGDINQPPLYNHGNADHDNTFHFFWQDNWRMKPRFTLIYGLGYTYESNALNYDLTMPQYLYPIFGAGSKQHQPTNFSPMLGFAWTVTSDNKTVVRGGAGIYYDTLNIEERLIERAMLGPNGTGRALLPDSLFFPQIFALNKWNSLPAPIQPTGLASNPLASQYGLPGITNFTEAELLQLIPSFYQGAQAELGPPNNTSLAIRNINVFKTGQDIMTNDFRPPFSEHASIGVQREVRTDFVVTADFVYRLYLHLPIRYEDLNHYFSTAGPVIPACTGAQAEDPTAQCSTGPIQGIVSGGRSHYEGLLLKANKRFSHRTAGQLSYAYSNLVGFNGVVDDSNWFASVGPQAGHQLLTGSLVVDLPWGFTISGITSYQSLGPIEPYISGVDLNGNGAFETGLTSGTPLPGIGFNQLGVNSGPGELTKLVNQFNASNPNLQAWVAAKLVVPAQLQLAGYPPDQGIQSGHRTRQAIAVSPARRFFGGGKRPVYQRERFERCAAAAVHRHGRNLLLE